MPDETSSAESTPPTTPAPTTPAAPVYKPGLGRIVHYVLPESSPRAGEHRAARMTCPAGAENANLHVDLDQADDLADSNGVFYPHLRVWSAAHDEETKAPGTWHWPERV